MLGRLRRLAGGLVRRAGLLPGGMPDGLGEDDALGDHVIDCRAVAFFPDPPENIYQLRQWYAPMIALDAEVGVTVICQDSRTARAIRTETDLSVLVVARNRTLDDLLRRGQARIAIYVGHANANMVALRSTEVGHVFLAHGDSDKAVSVSNQVKAFDLSLVAGQAAIDRYRSSVLLFEAGSRLRVIGRPQVPARSDRPAPGAGRGATVLYAPTWEGSQASNAYSSVLSHGVALVQSLAEHGFTVVYRPHPRLGASDRRFREGDAAVRAVVTELGGRVDLTPDAGEAMRGADVLVTDVSAMSTDWLSQRRPLLVTVPDDPRAAPTAGSRLHGAVPRVTAREAAHAGAMVSQALTDPAHTALLDDLAGHYLGGYSGAEATARFIEACGDMIDAVDQARAVRESGHASP